ncbi:uncharacterized protein BP5553_08085 [Venustampulla echinocandica]|uniref:Uncharacterized protein n=1 Tax=Venustampulla echinocandica TaxID=2656787 RepID=A0A370TFP3_9HELO|nr:uncharacterized protein BP5553_08085 [Venustampulla echinocandica]RDL33717.1 hypothetical protein BP5553_08085 [Venustampulla echinocandica]
MSLKNNKEALFVPSLASSRGMPSTNTVGRGSMTPITKAPAKEGLPSTEKGNSKELPTESSSAPSPANRAQQSETRQRQLGAPQLERWAYEVSNSELTLTERLERSRWECASD